MATKAKLVPSIIEYRVGDDLTAEQYHALVAAIGHWFSTIRKTKEPVALAKQVIDACLKGVLPKSGKPWTAAATLSWQKRIKIACRYDAETMTPIESASEESKKKKDKEKRRLARKAEREKRDDNYPKEYDGGVAGEATYGDDPLVFFTTQERENLEQRRVAMLREFPHLANAAAETKLRAYLIATILFERLQLRAVDPKERKQVKDIEYQLKEYTKQLVELEKALGIDPVTVSKMQKEREGGTIGDALVRLQQMGGWEKMRERALAEELILAYQMMMQPSPREDMGGYQLDEVGLYGLTKTRVIACPHCGNRNYAGFKIEELEAYLLKRGLITPVEGLLPGMYLELPPGTPGNPEAFTPDPGPDVVEQQMTLTAREVLAKDDAVAEAEDHAGD